MSLSQTTVAKLYSSVIDDVISGVREFFQDEGVDEQVLMELKNTWEGKLAATKAVEQRVDEVILPTPLKPVSAAHPKPHPPHQISHGGGGVPAEYANKNVAIQITLPAQQGVADSQPRAITIQVPASALQGNQLQQVLTGPVITATMAMPPSIAPTLLQQHVTAALQGQATSQGLAQQVTAHQNVNSSTGLQSGAAFPSLPVSQGVTRTRGGGGGLGTDGNGLSQVDGPLVDSSDDDDEDEEEEEDDGEEDEDDIDEDKDEEENDENDEGAEEEPLNSGDDVSEEDPSEMFDTDNVVVCQYDKITRTRNKWKFYLKDGIMNLAGKDYVFQKSNGDAEW